MAMALRDSCCFFLLCMLVWIPSFITADVNNVFGDVGRALIPPRGWNSYASYSWVISEDDFLENAELVSKYLRNFGYQYVVVDALWFRKVEPGVSSYAYGHDTLDAWGRPLPDPDRWPSSKGGRGFRDVADRVHQLGLKFGIQVVRGIHKAAVQNNTPVYGAQGSNRKHRWRARDIAVFGQDCSYMPDCFIGVNVSSEGGRLFLKSLYRQYADWGVDFIKLDCVFGEKNLLLDEILAVSQAILETGRQIVFSVSPGENATPVMAAAIANVTNMYRVTHDVRDSWVDLEPEFNIARDFAAAGLLGAPGLGGGRSWPDLDILPFGWLTDPGAEDQAYRASRLTEAEQQTQITLWAMAKSPLMFGGDMRHLDQTTLDILTNPTVLDINAYSFGNGEVLRFATGVNALKVVECGSANNTNTSWKIGNASAGSTQICWRGKSNSQRCFNWKPLRKTQISMHQIENRDDSFVGQVWTRNPPGEVCLDAVAAKDHRKKHQSKHLSACRRHPSQTWRLTPHGHLVDEHLGRCAIVVEQDDMTRIWVAYGSSGQVYVAFSNASPKKAHMSIPLDELLDGFYTTLAVTNSSKGDMIFTPLNRTKWRCSGEEVWSGKKVVETEAVSFRVDGHGCALFVFACNFNLQSGDVRTLSRALLAAFIGIVAVLTLVNLMRYCWLSRGRSK